MPFVYRDSGSYSDEELREFAQQSIWQMEEQIQQLRKSFGLDLPIHLAVHSAHRQTTNVRSIPQKVVAPASSSNRNAVSKTDSVEGEFSSSTRLAEADILDDFADALWVGGLISMADVDQSNPAASNEKAVRVLLSRA
ncbi:MAG: hypothetical protein ACFE0I_18885 [Elainellaceae cyanobacterium]